VENMALLIRSLSIFVELIEALIIIRIFMSIFRINFNTTLGRLVYELTEPILSPSKRLLDKIGLGRGMFDFSPWVSILILRILTAIIISFLGQL
jgi:YggT family protein